MRSVRTLDILFTVNSAVKLLSRVAASQTPNLCPESKNHEHIVVPDGKGQVKNTIIVTSAESSNDSFSGSNKTVEQTTSPVQKLPLDTTNVTSISKTSQIPKRGPISTPNIDLNTPIRQTFRNPSIIVSPPPMVNEVELPIAPTLKSSKVPSSRIARLFHYGSLAAGLGMGAAGEFVRRATNPKEHQSGSLLMSEANVSRLVDKLSRMRGAALKLGQFLSIQDSHTLPPQVEQIFRQVQNSAHYMPNWQMEKVMTSELGENWRSHFSSFNPIPIAAASIGQVHSATLASNGMPLAIKIQFPAVAQSISSDINNLSMLLSASALLPKGLFLESTLKATKAELEDECNYIREAECARRFYKELEDDDRFEVMRVVDELSTEKVLVMERMDGVPIVQAENWPQETRDEICTSILSLCLRELFHFRFMQTDPNWTNFLYNQKRRKIQLIDFGASREYSKEFMDNWLRLLEAGIAADKEGCIKYSLRLGYLTGEENQEMLDAHTQSIMLLGIPFRKTTHQPFSFAEQDVSEKIRELIPIMLSNRLTPPPRETYSLNRKLSGAFLLCTKLKARVNCADMWHDITRDYSYTTAD